MVVTTSFPRSHSTPKPRPPPTTATTTNRRRPRTTDVASRYLTTSTSSSSSTTTTTTSSNSSSSNFTPTRRNAELQPSNAAKVLLSSGGSTRRRSLSVSFQGESFSVRRESGVEKVRRDVATPERRRVVTKENSSASMMTMTTPWPKAKGMMGMNSLNRSVDLGKRIGNDKVVRALRESLVNDNSNNSNRNRIADVNVSVSRTSDIGRTKNDNNSSSVGLGEGERGGSRTVGVVGRSGTPQRVMMTPRKLVSEGVVGSPRGVVNRREVASPIRGVGGGGGGGLVRPQTPRGVVSSRGFSSPIRGGGGGGGGGGVVRPETPRGLVNSRGFTSPIRGGGLVRPETPRGGGLVRPETPRGVVNSRGFTSPIRGGGGMVRSASPSKVGVEKGSLVANLRGVSPGRVRSGVMSMSMSPTKAGGEVRRRVKVGDDRLGDAHLLRILHCRHLQWRFANARVEAAMAFHRNSAERSLYNAWKQTSDLREEVSSKRTELQLVRHKLKLLFILRRQMICLEEWALMEEDHCSSFSGITDSLKASTIRIPVIAGARADIHDMMDAICSAADVMHAMASSICSLSSKVEAVNSLIAELADTTSKEHSVLNECKDVMATLAAMQVTDWSLRSHRLQITGLLKCN